MKLVSYLVTNGIRSLVFCKFRSTVELVLSRVHSHLKALPNGQHLVDRVVSYRAGYSSDRRRNLEKKIFHGGG